MTKAQKQPAAPEGADVGSWRGYVQYRCTACPFDTLSRPAFEDHWRLAHTSLESHEAEQPAFTEAAAPVTESQVED